MCQEDRPQLDRIGEEAAAWVVRLSDAGHTAADRDEFAAWRSQSLHHDIAYEKSLAAWEAFDRLRVYAGATVKADVLAPKAGPAPRFRAAKIAAVIAGSVGLIGATFVLGNAPAYATGVGERRVVVLDDGSQVELNTNSKIVVRYRKGLREVELVRGEAVFHAAQDARPFIVVADQARVSAEHSEISVRLGDQGPLVRVNEGEAKLAAQSDDIVLSPGAQAAYGPAGAKIEPVSEAEVSRSQAWRQGAIILDGQSLGEAVREFNRYNQQKLVVADNDLSSLRLGGYFRTGDVTGFVNALTKSFPVSAARSGDDRIYLKHKTQTPAQTR